jgi:hypothetical protein
MKKIAIAIMLFLVPLSSQALFEVRAGYGTNTLDEDTVNTVIGNLDIDNGKGLNVDFILYPPLFGDLGLGLRYEIMKYDFTLHSVVDVPGEVEMKRLSFLANYRFLDTLGYFGLIGTFDIDSKSTLTVSGTDSDGDTDFIWTAGVEGGVHLGLISIGAEVGKLFGGSKGDATNPEVELDGLYGKVLVGFGF